MTQCPPARILVVDDDADVCRSLKLALELEGYAVTTARNGREALARRTPVDVLITDLFMPEADGFETIQGLRRSHPKAKVIVLSGGSRLAKADYFSVARAIGADVTLRKPVDPADLSTTIKALLAG